MKLHLGSIIDEEWSGEGEYKAQLESVFVPDTPGYQQLQTRWD